MVLQFKSEFARFTDEDNRVPLPGESMSAGGTFSSPPMTAEELGADDQFSANISAADPFAGLDSGGPAPY